jgi:hypothetical protein
VVAFEAFIDIHIHHLEEGLEEHRLAVLQCDVLEVREGWRVYHFAELSIGRMHGPPLLLVF